MIQQIQTLIDAICQLHKLKKPLTVPSAGKMIAEYGGVDKVIELFQGAYKECLENPDKENPFAFAAYKVTLEKVLIPMKENDNENRT
jgi:hypothetical protein